MSKWVRKIHSWISDLIYYSLWSPEKNFLILGAITKIQVYASNFAKKMYENLEFYTNALLKCILRNPLLNSAFPGLFSH